MYSNRESVSPKFTHGTLEVNFVMVVFPQARERDPGLKANERKCPNDTRKSLSSNKTA